MAVFAYRAADGGAAVVRGTVTADSPRQAWDQLRSRGLVVEEITPHEPAAGFSWWPLKRRGRHAAKLASTVRDLATLLGAGIPLLESLDALADQYRGHYRASLLAVRERVAAGSGLAEAMREQPEIFDDLSIQMVAVGENSGTLDVVLDQLADFSERYQQFKDKVITSLMYPLVVLSMAVGVGMFLRFGRGTGTFCFEDYAKMSQSPTAWSLVVRVHGWWLALVGVAVREENSSDPFFDLEGEGITLLEACVFRPGDDLFLQLLGQITEVVAVARHSNDQIPVRLGVLLGPA